MADKYIKLDEKKIKRLIREAQMFQDDIVCAIGTDFMQNIATAENKMIFDILKGLQSEPTADVVEVKHGKWYKHTIKKHGDSLWHCSVCEKIAPTDGGYCWEFTPYCPYCGAKMEVGNVE